MPQRIAAYKILIAILDKKHPLDEAFSCHTKDLAVRERAFVRALIGLNLRHKGEIDAIIDQCLGRPLPKDVANVRHILSLGIAQILYMETAAHAAVTTSVDLAKACGFLKQSGMVNAILRRVLREPDVFDKPRPHANIPGWLYKSWVANYGQETSAAIAKAQSFEPPLDLTIRNPDDAETWAEHLSGTILPNGTLRCRPSGPVTELPGYDLGAWWVQDAAASLPAKLLGKVKGLRVADLCAAPGGKTLQLAAMGAHVTAVDRSAPRLKRLDANLERMRLKAEVVVRDASKWQPDKLFDAILLDAPCSATGTLRRHPDVAWTKTPEDIQSLANTQRKILAKVSRMLKPDGVLVYCTCSLQKSEEAAGPDTPPPGLVFDPIHKRELKGWDFAIRKDGTLRTLPCHLPDIGGMDGFYAARFRKPLTE